MFLVDANIHYAVQYVNYFSNHFFVLDVLFLYPLYQDKKKG